MFLEIIKFIFFAFLIVLIAKYLLVTVLRKLSEALDLSPKMVGNIAGCATSVPELLTVSFSAFAGFIGASSYNILSSNIINMVQYTISVYSNKNQKTLSNRAIKIDLFLVVLTIIIPIIMFITNIEFNITIVPIFFLLAILFYYINHNSHKLYLLNQEKKLSIEIDNEKKWIKGKKRVIVKYTIYLIIIAVLLYVVGNNLSNSLTNLCNIFGISQIILGILLGFITSIPELITFFESQKFYKKDISSDLKTEHNTSELGIIEATNNLLTSNLLNLFIIQSFGIIIFYLHS